MLSTGAARDPGSQGPPTLVYVHPLPPPAMIPGSGTGQGDCPWGIRDGAPAGQERGVRASCGDRHVCLLLTRPPGHQGSRPAPPRTRAWQAVPRGPGEPHRGEAVVGAGGRGWGLTIMFSRACLASQQFRNTGMNRFRRGGQNICGGDGSGGGGLGGPRLSRRLTHRDDEGQRVDHLQDEGHAEDLLPDVALGSQGGGLQSGWQGGGTGVGWGLRIETN